jgi:hypothetical protein
VERVNARIKLVTRMIVVKFGIVRETISAISNIVQYVHCTILQIGRHGCLPSIVRVTISAIINIVQYVQCTVLKIGRYGCLPTIMRGTISDISNIVQYVHCTVLQIGCYGCLPTDLTSYIVKQQQKQRMGEIYRA